MYVHARPSAKAAFDQACEQLVSTAIPAHSRTAGAVASGRQAHDKEKERLQTADALLVVGTEEDDLSIDMAVVGRHAPQPRHRGDPEAPPGRCPRQDRHAGPRDTPAPRASIARLYWLDGGDPGWTATLREHLVHAATAELAVAGVGANA